MREKIGKLYVRLKEITSNLGKWVSAYWLLYSFLKTIILLVMSFLTFLVLLFLGWSATMVIGAVAFFFSLCFMLLDKTKSIVAKESPEDFVTTEKWERWVGKAFLVFIVSFFTFVALGSIGGYNLMGKMQLTSSEQVLLYSMYALTPVVFFASAAVLPFIINLLEQTIPYVSSCTRASARIHVVFAALSKNSEMKTVREVMPLFKESLKIYNDYLVEVFDFVIRDPDRYYKYVRLSALSCDKDDFAKVKDSLTNLATILEQKVGDPFQFVRVIRTMTGESDNRPCDLFKEIEIEPHFRKWIRDHFELLKLVISVSITLIGSIALPLVLKFLFPSNP